MRFNRFRRKRSLQLITYYKKNSSFSEEYRTLRTNISFAKAGGGLRSYLITSPESGEGKSTTAANLAVVMAQQGKEVLLIDADIRKPTVHAIFHTDNLRGLTNLLTGQGDLMSDTQVTGIDKLSLLTSGPLAPNPADLLSSEEMEKVIDEAKQHFDQVIIDSPPALMVTDAQLLANLCDGLILVVRNRMTSIDRAGKSADILQKAKGKFLGVVLNDKKENMNSNNYYSYYSGDY
ncbi:MAG: CpsD/CapB family tyrosine-protein kinase [Sporolactobacillus sp.]